jgi:3-deoxy-D-manno-octulosonic-acid transferase
MAVGGGQNPLEPARLGCAVAMGPMVANFAEIAADLAEAGALQMVADAVALERWVDALLRDPTRRAAIGAAGVAASRRAEGLPALVAGRLLALMGPVA